MKYENRYKYYSKENTIQNANMAINIYFNCLIYIMNKLLKYILIGISIFSLFFASFSKADITLPAS